MFCAGSGRGSRSAGSAPGRSLQASIARGNGAGVTHRHGVITTGRENAALRGLVVVYRLLSNLAAQDSGIEAVAELMAERMDATVAVVDEKMTVVATAASAGSPRNVADYVRDRVGHPGLAQVLGRTERS
jgi:hypothetical protein